VRHSPAAVPAALLVVLCAWAPKLAPVPAWAPLGLAAGGLALGGSGGAALLGAAAGLGLGELRRSGEIPAPAGRVTEVEGTICGLWRERVEFASRSARLCPGWLRVGRQLVLRPPRLFVDLPSAFAPPRFGTTVRVRGTLNRFPGLANATEVAPGPWRLRVKSQVFVTEVASSGAFASTNNALRARIERSIGAAGVGGRPGVALTRALVLGDEGGMTNEGRRALRRAGLAHLFAVSGFNLTVVAAFASVLAGAGPRGARFLLPGLAVIVYLATVGPEPSMLRASIMAGLALALLAWGRAGSATQALALAAMLLIAVEPAMVDDVGFRLSFGATAGLIAGTRNRFAALARLPPSLAAALTASLAAQLGALPFSVAAFGELSPLAPLLNLVAVPWAALWLLLGMAWIAVALVLPSAAGRLAPLLDLGAAPFAGLERLPPAPWVSLALPGGIVAGAAVALVAAGVLSCRGARRWLLLVAAALAATGPRPAVSALSEVAFLDVGQGDAALVRDGPFVALIDGGGLVGRDLGAAVLRPALLVRGLGAVDVAILSHSDRDHCQGLLDLAALVPIREVWSSASQLARGCGAQLALRARRGARALAAGDVVWRGRGRFEILHPAPGQYAADPNAESLVVAVDLDGRRFLFGGDLAAADERAVAARAGSSLTADVLKVSHHGAARSTPLEWLAEIRPRWAVVSAGVSNAYGHPAAATLARLRAAGVLVLRTDRDGEITFERRAAGPWRLSLPASPRAVAPTR
jgi:competence protein ComEC